MYRSLQRRLIVDREITGNSPHDSGSFAPILPTRDSVSTLVRPGSALRTGLALHAAFALAHTLAAAAIRVEEMAYGAELVVSSYSPGSFRMYHACFEGPRYDKKWWGNAKKKKDRTPKLTPPLPTSKTDYKSPINH